MTLSPKLITKHQYVHQYIQYGSFGSVRMCTEQIVPFFHLIQTINAVLEHFDVVRQIAVY